MSDTADLDRPRVLLVDDAKTNISALIAALGDDYKIGVATSGAKALEYVRRTPPDLILLDIMMPEMDGYEVCSRLKGNECTRQIPVIFLTALTNVDEKVKGFAVGAVDYVTKPFEVAEVQARVRTHVELERLRRELAVQNLALADAHARLSQQLKELAGRDRLVRFQMANDSLPAAYGEIAGVFQQVLEVSQVVLYTPLASGNHLAPVAAATRSGQLSSTETETIPTVDAADGTTSIALAFLRRRPRSGAPGEVSAIPIVYGDEILGVIAISMPPPPEAEEATAFGMLSRLAGEAALVIRAARVAEQLHAGEFEANDLIALAGEVNLGDSAGAKRA